MPKKKVTKPVEKKTDGNKELVDFLMARIPGCFDDFPRRPLNRARVEKLVEELLD